MTRRALPNVTEKAFQRKINTGVLYCNSTQEIFIETFITKISGRFFLPENVFIGSLNLAFF